MNEIFLAMAMGAISVVLIPMLVSVIYGIVLLFEKLVDAGRKT